MLSAIAERARTARDPTCARSLDWLSLVHAPLAMEDATLHILTTKMSTQQAGRGHPVTVLPESSLQHVRLLELPAELLALVTSETPPRWAHIDPEPLYQRLTIT